MDSFAAWFCWAFVSFSLFVALGVTSIEPGGKRFRRPLFLALLIWASPVVLRAWLAVVLM